MARIGLCALALAVFAACDDSPPAEPDASVDAGPQDAGRRDAGHEPGPMCMPECSGVEACCVDRTTDTPVCVNLRNDPRHCGVCEIDCIASHRGDSCSASQCSCGTARLGCTGNRQSWCCPPRQAGGDGYCADLDRSAADCGACNVHCDPRRADRCDGGRCVCGRGRDACAGTPESTCCTFLVDTMCVDTTSDERHCGACNNACPGGSRCEGGTCTFGESTCDAGCGAGQVCCDGTCCTRDRCTSGRCGGASDGGTGDGGTSDGGV